MAGNVKGITIEFRGDTTKLQSAIRTLNSEISSTDKELQQVNKALKFNPGNTDLLAQKQQLLKQRVSETNEKLKSLKQALAQMDADESTDKTSAEYRNLQRQIIECESQVKHFNAELIKVQAALSPLGQVGTKFSDIGDKATKLGQSMKTVSTYAAAAATAIGALAVKSGISADDLNTLSKVTGIGTDKLQLYAQAADLVDVSVEAIAKSNTRMKKNMLTASQGTGDAAKAFDRLGVSVTDSNGSLRDQDKVFQETLKALGGMKNETERDALAMQIFGKSATELNPLIEDCGETYATVMETFKQNDIEIVDQETLDRANEFNDSIDTIKATVSQALMVIGTKLAGYLAPMMETIQEKISAIAGKIANLNPKILAVIGAFAGIVAAIAPSLLIFGKLSSSIGGVISKVAQLATKFGGLKGILGTIKANPILLVAAAFALMYANSEEFRNAVNGLVSSIASSLMPVFQALAPVMTSVGQIIGAIAQAFGALLAPTIDAISRKIQALAPTFKTMAAIISAVFKGISAPIKSVASAVESAVAKIRKIINGTKLQFPKIKLPHFSVSGGKSPYGIGGKGSLPKFSVNWYKSGGIFDDPSIIGVGEAGPEAVLPIEKLQVMLDSSSEKMAAAVISALSNMNLGGASQLNANLYIDGKELTTTIAPLMETQLDTISRRNNRKLGLV